MNEPLSKTIERFYWVCADDGSPLFEARHDQWWGVSVECDVHDGLRVWADSNGMLDLDAAFVRALEKFQEEHEKLGALHGGPPHEHTRTGQR